MVAVMIHGEAETDAADDLDDDDGDATATAVVAIVVVFCVVSGNLTMTISSTGVLIIISKDLLLVPQEGLQQAAQKKGGYRFSGL